MKTRSPDGRSLHNQNTIIIKIMVAFFKIWKKYNEIQLAKNKMDLINREIKNPPPSPFPINEAVNNTVTLSSSK